jgi:hypothetical protein
MDSELVTVPCVLPPRVTDRLIAEGRIDPTIELADLDTMQIQARFIEDLAYRKRIWELTQQIWLCLFEPGTNWGSWPDNLDDCLAIAGNLSALIFGELDESLCQWPEEVIEDLERECREDCVSLEVLLINRLFDMKSDPLL